jgi:hypothetical protein
MELVELFIQLVKPAGGDYVLGLQLFTEEDGGEDRWERVNNTIFCDSVEGAVVRPRYDF